MFCIWLLPSSEHSKIIEKTISANMALLKRPSFLPHMTLFDSNQPLDRDCRKTFFKIVNNINKHQTELITLKITPCISGAYFYKSFFCEIENHPNLQFIYEQIKSLDTSSTYQFIPHISLAYGNNNKTLLGIDLQEINFDRIALVLDNNEESNTAISSWKIIESCKLGRG